MIIDELNFFSLIYIFSAVVSLLSFLFLSKLNNVSLYSFTSIFYFLCYFIVILPGYMVSAGKADDLIYTNFYRGFDYHLYFIYLATAFILPLGLILGNIIAGKKWKRLSTRGSFSLTYPLLVLFFLIYSALYFLWLPSVPVLTLLSKGDVVTTALERLQVTHGISDLNPPFLFRYWRNILQIFSMCLFLIFVINIKLSGGFKRMSVSQRFFLILLFFYVVFCQLFTVEKAPLSYFIISLIVALRKTEEFSVGKVKRVSDIFSGRNLFAVFLILCAFQLMYFYFMGGGGVSAAFSRIARQTASNYLQIEYARELGFLGFGGFGSKLFSVLGAAPAENLSKMAIMEMYPAYNSSTLSGSAGGMFATNLYFAFGWFFLPVSIGYVVALGFIDRVFANSIRACSNIDVSTILIAFYSVFCVIFAMRALGNVFSIFSIDTFLSPELIIFILFFFVFIRFRPRILSARK